MLTLQLERFAYFLRQTQQNGDTALHVAVRRKDLEMTRLLVDHKGDVNQQNVSLDIK